MKHFPFYCGYHNTILKGINFANQALQERNDRQDTSACYKSGRHNLKGSVISWFFKHGKRQFYGIRLRLFQSLIGIEGVFSRHCVGKELDYFNVF